MTIVAVLLAMALAAPVGGPFDGKWYAMKDVGSCHKPQEAEGAPVVISKRNYDQHEAHCQWGALTPAGKDVWTARGTCAVEGDQAKGNFRFALAGELLTMKDVQGVSSTYRRCPAK